MRRLGTAMVGRLERATLAALTAATVAMAAVPTASAAGGPSDRTSAARDLGPQPADPVTSDFDGDGRSDLAITAPFDDAGGVDDAGSVTILYGSADGLTSNGGRLFSQATSGIADVPEPGDFFGWTAAAGDFDQDGYGDLAVGVLGEDLGPTRPDTGAVHVLYGSPTGLHAARSQLWTGDSPGLPGAAGPADAFGTALAAGDVNGDGAADLAIGARGKEVAGGDSAGAAMLLLGGEGGDGGLGSTGARLFTQNSPGVLDTAEPSDMFGTGLAMGDLDGDGFEDLAVGVIGEDLGVPGEGVGDAGAVAVLYGSDAGITAAADQLWTQDSPGVPGTAENPDLMGASLAIGDFDGDGFGDLAADSFGESVGGSDLAGGITVLYGADAGLTAGGAQEITQATSGVPDTPQTNDQFGNPVAAGDFDGDGRDDLVAAVPNESIDGVVRAGAAYLMPGSPAGLTATGGVLWSQSSPGVRDDAERDDSFGAAIGVGNYGRGPHPDIAITARQESVGAVRDAGSVSVLFAGATGLTVNGNQQWTRDRAGVPGVAREGDWFGFALGSA